MTLSNKINNFYEKETINGISCFLFLFKYHLLALQYFWTFFSGDPLFLQWLITWETGLYQHFTEQTYKKNPNNNRRVQKNLLSEKLTQKSNCYSKIQGCSCHYLRVNCAWIEFGWATETMGSIVIEEDLIYKMIYIFNAKGKWRFINLNDTSRSLYESNNLVEKEGHSYSAFRNSLTLWGCVRSFCSVPNLLLMSNYKLLKEKNYEA